MSAPDALSTRIAAAVDMLHQNNLGPVRAALLQLCQAAIISRQDDLIDSDRFRRLVSEPKAQSILCDVISVIWVEIDIAKDDAQAALLVDFLQGLVRRALLPLHLLRVRLEHDLLARAETIASAETARRSDRVFRTKMLYTQPKFNLIREETEGFAKLIVELEEIGRCPTRPLLLAPAKIKNRVASLIGYFDLDPNRVADLFLDAMIHSYPNPASYQLVRDLLLQLTAPGATMTALVGVKFQRSGDTPNPSLYSVAVDLIDHEYLIADDLFLAYLSPASITDLNAIRARLEQTIRDVIDQFTHVNLNADKKGAQDKPYASPDLPTWTEPCPKLELIAALLREGGDRGRQAAWTLLNRIQSCIPARYGAVGDGLAWSLDLALDPYYRRLRQFAVLRDDDVAGDVVVDFDQCLALLWQYLSYLGPFLYRHTILFAKICRVLTQALIDRRQAGAVIDVADPPLLNAILCHSILGAYSLMPGTTGTAGELHAVLQQIPYPHRYALYQAWRQDVYRAPSYPELTLALRYAERHTRYFRKRIIAGKIKEVGRQLTRFSHQSPLVVLQLIIEQIQAFDNLSAPAVDSFKYVTALSHDTIAFVVLEQLTAPSRDKLSNDAQTPAAWFASLCAFAGLVARRYPQIVQMAPLLTYVAAQLKNGRSPIDLLLLRELITNMSSVVVLEEMSGAQILAQGGSRALRDALIESQQPRAKLKRNPPYLLAALHQADLLAPLYILIGQQIARLSTSLTTSPALRAAAHHLDQARDVLLVYKEFLDLHLVPLKAYAAAIPSLFDLVHRYHLTPEVAFALVRPVLHVARIASPPPDAAATVEAMTLAATCRTLLPTPVWRSISPSLFAMFWSLSLYDIYVPVDQYADQDRRLEQKIAALAKTSTSTPDGADQRKAQKERDRLKRIQERLQKDVAEQHLNHTSVMAKIASESASWLADCADRSLTTIVFLQHCVLPRVASSAADALYAAKFLRLMHDRHTIRTLQIYTDLVRLLRPILSSATSNEAARFGRFACELLAYLNEWRGACPDDHDAPMPPSIAWRREPTRDDTITVLEFVKFVQKWSASISKSIARLLRSPEPHIVQNALLFLNAVADQWPRSTAHGARLLGAVAQLLGAQAPGSSLRILSQGVLAQLEKRKADWIDDLPEPKPAAPEPEPAPVVAKPESPTRSARRSRAKSPSDHGGRRPTATSATSKPINVSPTYDDNTKRRRVERSLGDKIDVQLSYRNESSRSESYRDHGAGGGGGGYYDRSETLSTRMGSESIAYADKKLDERQELSRSERFKEPSSRFESSRDKDSGRFESSSRSDRMTDSRSERLVMDGGRGGDRLEMGRSDRGMDFGKERSMDSRGGGNDRNRSRSDRDQSSQRRRRQ